MSDSKKTIQEECYGTCWGAQQRIDELTQQITAANERIKRLEEAGGKLAVCAEKISILSNDPWWIGFAKEAIREWDKAQKGQPVSDTPRCDTMEWSWTQLVFEARQLERELSAANERISGLESQIRLLDETARLQAGQIRGHQTVIQ
jgi:predicted  nucleic acid-binding Zn-ribbon protein